MNIKTILIVLISPFLLNFFSNSKKDSISKSEYFTENINFSKNPTGSEKIETISHQEEQEMIYLINKLRNNLGLKSLVRDESLMNSARYHAADMANENYFDHDTYNLTYGELKFSIGTFERIKLFCFGVERFPNSENIAAGNNDANSTFNQWANSPGHYKNMINPNSKFIGIGHYEISGSDFTYYWVMNTAI